MRLIEARAAASSGAVAQVENLVLAHGGRPVLDGVTVAFRQGEIAVLLGANGAGKTSLLRALSGRMAPAAGRVLIAGADPARDGAARRLIGLVPQEIALYPKLTVRENLEVFGRLSGLERRRMPARIDAVLSAARLGDVAGREVGILSGGYQRRANIAAALLGEPALLLLDEPTVGVDLEARGAVHDVLVALRDAGVAVVLTTHDFEQAEILADRVAFLREGRLVEEGTPKAVLARAYGGAMLLAAILSAPPDASAEAALRARRLVPGEGRLNWWLLSREDMPANTGLYDDLRRAGVPVREVRLRAPGLDTLFLDLAAGRAGS